MTDAYADRTAAIVVTYNRKELLGECVDSLLAQRRPLDAVYLIDNCSADGTGAYLRDRGWLAPDTHVDDGASESLRSVTSPAVPDVQVEIRYVRLPENTGGAGGFHEGVKRGCADGFDWLWLMDDDLLTDPEAVAALARQREALRAAGHPPFLLNSLILSRERMDGDTLAFPLQELSRRRLPKMGVYYHRLSQVRDRVEDGLYRWACPFNGTLIPTAAIAQIGLPNKEFFIWGDERDFLWRAAKVLDLLTVVDSRVFHPACGARVFDWKNYYHIRNSFVINKHFNLTVLRNLKLIAASLVLGLRHGMPGLRLVLRAIKDGLTRNLGKREDLGG